MEASLQMEDQNNHGNAELAQGTKQVLEGVALDGGATRGELDEADNTEEDVLVPDACECDNLEPELEDLVFRETWECAELVDLVFWEARDFIKAGFLGSGNVTE